MKEKLAEHRDHVLRAERQRRAERQALVRRDNAFAAQRPAREV
jgi:hypothetical protein